MTGSTGRRKLLKIEEAYAFIKNEKTNVSKPGLSRIRKLMRLLDNPEKKMKLIHVVGTNGKGSVSAMISSVLKAGGYSVGTMSSPALFGLKDYYRVLGEPVTDEDYCNAAEALSVVCGGLSDEEYPSEFELSVALGILLFAAKDCEYVVLEAGMGGAKDATNLETPGIMTVITHVAMDHEKYLGSTVGEIIREKCGIVSPGEPIVLADNEKEVRKYCEQYAFDNGCPFLYANDPQINLSLSRLGARLKLPGTFQKENAKTVCAAAYTLRMKDVFLTDEAVKKGLEDVKLPFRFDIRRNKPYFILDGGHNPDCTKALCETLSLLPNADKFLVITGVMADKDYAAMYPMLLPFASKFLTVTPDNPRSLSAKDLRKYLKSIGAEADAMHSLKEAAERAADAYRDGANVLCTGTLYMMAELEQSFRDVGLFI